MYTLLKSSLLFLLRVPDGPPDAPTGDHGNAMVFRASKAFLFFQMIRFVFRTVPALLVSMFILVMEFRDIKVVEQSLVFAVVVVVFVTSAFFRYLLVRLDYDLRYYVVTDRSLRIRQGAWHIEEATFTFANIQNLTIDQGPIERMLGIANVRIETAGGGSVVDPKGGLAHHGALAGIADATGVRDRILARLRQYRDAGLGDERSSLAPAHVSHGAGLSPEAVSRLREVRDEARRLELAFSRPVA